MNSLKKETKKEFEVLLKRIWENHASSIDGRMIWNVNDDDDPDDGWVYADETIWNFIESTISQTRQEIIEEIKKQIPNMVVYKGYGPSGEDRYDETLLVRVDLEELLEDLNKK